MQVVTGVGFADFLVKNVEAFLRLDFEIHDHVETDCLFFEVYVKAVELQSPFMCFYQLQDVAADFGGFIVFGVVGIDAHACQKYAGFLVHASLHPAREFVEFFDSHGVGEFKVYRTEELVRTMTF